MNLCCPDVDYLEVELVCIKSLNARAKMIILLGRVPTPVAIVVSACAFAGAHLTPGEFPQLVALGEYSCNFCYSISITLSLARFSVFLYKSIRI